MASLQPPGVSWAELPTPLSHGFVRRKDPPLGEQIFYIPKAHTVSVVEPHGVADDLGRKAMPQVDGPTRCHPLHYAPMAMGSLSPMLKLAADGPELWGPMTIVGDARTAAAGRKAGTPWGVSSTLFR